ncbi:MAG: response regulator [Verrucomicrobia bacterium]|jgi:DNA-binding NarL/FixJ family response regulator|nr:response regulator [Verrucomicrobiota bacterium]
MMEKGRPTVLLVDDVPANLGVLIDTLTAEYALSVAESAESCLEALQHVLPDLILLDVRLPGLDGFQLYGKLREEPDWNRIPVIFMTAVDEPEQKAQALEAGAVDYVTKPLHVPEVMARVRTHLRIIGLTRELAARKEELEEEVELRRDTEEQLQHSLATAILSADHGGRVVFSTKRARQLIARYFETGHFAQLPDPFLAEWKNAVAGGAGGWNISHLDGRGLLEVTIFQSPAIRNTTLFAMEERGAAGADALRSLGLSPRESEVLFWIAEGKSYPEIAVILEASVRTIQKHAENLLRKLGVESRSAAMRVAIEKMRPPR